MAVGWMGVTGGILVGNLVKVVSGEENTAVVDSDGTIPALDLSEDDTRECEFPVVAAVMATPVDNGALIGPHRGADNGNELAPPNKHVIGVTVARSPLLMLTLAASEMHGVSMV